jgi:rifampicin phosphotransferase
MSVLVDVADLLDPARIGYKFSRQAELLQRGFPVPSFCCVPAAEFDFVLASVGPELASLEGGYGRVHRE